MDGGYKSRFKDSLHQPLTRCVCVGGGGGLTPLRRHSELRSNNTSARDHLLVFLPEMVELRPLHKARFHFRSGLRRERGSNSSHPFPPTGCGENNLALTEASAQTKRLLCKKIFVKIKTKFRFI